LSATTSKDIREHLVHYPAPHPLHHLHVPIACIPDAEVWPLPSSLSSREPPPLCTPAVHSSKHCSSLMLSVTSASHATFASDVLDQRRNVEKDHRVVFTATSDHAKSSNSMPSLPKTGMCKPKRKSAALLRTQGYLLPTILVFLVLLWSYMRLTISLWIDLQAQIIYHHPEKLHIK